MPVAAAPDHLPVAAGTRGPVAPNPAHSVLTPLSFGSAVLAPRAEWGERQQRNATATLPHCTRELVTSGAISNFERLVGESDAEFRGMVFQDSDLFKHLEALAWELARTGDPGVDAEIERMAALLARVQEPSGYLNTAYQGTTNVHFSVLAQDHEHYCAGHLFQAAVADHRATGSARLLDIAVRYADHLVVEFGGNRRADYDGHPEVETALVELYRETGTRAYLDLARQFVANRGSRVFTTGPNPTAHYGRVDSYYVDDVPVREAETIEGHSVRAMYLEAGVVDVAVEDGDADLLAGSIRRWEQMVSRKMYITGGTGSRHSTEGFGDPWELPADRAYAETCAAIAAVHWSWRLLLATGDSRFADLIDLVLNNAFVGGVGLDGVSFCYSNPLQVRDGHVADTEMQAGHRLEWFVCACCPPNVARMVASVHSYALAVSRGAVHVTQYMAGAYATDYASLDIATAYPWDGAICVTVNRSVREPWALQLRVPGWCESFTVEVNGVAVAEPIVKQHELVIDREWLAGDIVRLTLEMPAHLVAVDSRVDALRGTVAIQRGPIVYCVEAADQPDADLDAIEISADAALSIVPARGLDRPAISVTARELHEQGPLYRPFGGEEVPKGSEVTLTAIPYQLWANREVGAMRVFVPLAR